MEACIDPSDKVTYRKDTFQLIRRLAPTIRKFSTLYSVPPIAVAGAIADEYNTRTGFKGIIDWFQDEVLLNWMPNSFIAFDVILGFDSKLLNATKHDIGLGNIKLETAMKVYKRNKKRFGKEIKDWSAKVDYIRTDAGTVHIAALVIKRAIFLFQKHIKGYSQEMKEAVYVTYYKQGPSYLDRFLAKPAARRQGGISPGEGCRVYHQRNEFKKALV